MSKINATYSSGYYIAPDVDFRKLEEQQRQEQLRKRKRGEEAGEGDENVKRQTFAIPFDLICLHCNRRIARGSHVYANRRTTADRYMDVIRIWELEILCRYCRGKYYLLTDPATPKETGGYHCGSGCRRVEGDFYALNQQNQAAREAWEKEKAEAEANPLAALERENEATRQLEERNRRIEEAVESHAEHDSAALLAMLRSRPRSTLPTEGEDSLRHRTGAAGEAGDHDHVTDDGLDNAIRALGGDGGVEGEEEDGEAEDEDERAFRLFTAEVEQRWRAQERLQRQTKAEDERRQYALQHGPRQVAVEEVEAVSERYGGARPKTVELTSSSALANGADSQSVRSAPSIVASLKAVTGSSSTGTATAPHAVAAPSTARRNIFLMDSDDELEEENQEPSTKVGARRSVPQLQSSRTLPERNGRLHSSLLRRLVDDSESDDGEV